MLINSIIDQANVVGSSSIIKQSFANLYSFPRFRYILNAGLHLITQSRISFEVTKKTFTDTDNGVCITSRDSAKNKVYLIQIKESQPHILIHELAHATEKEFGIDLNHIFLNAISTDLTNLSKKQSILAQTMIDKVLIQEVLKYPTHSKLSEFFARFHDIFARTQDVNPQGKDCYVKIEDLEKHFPNTSSWVEKEVTPKINEKLPKNILDYSHTVPLVLTGTHASWADRISKKGTKFTY